MTGTGTAVVVTVPTYRRPDDVARLLLHVAPQAGEAPAVVSVVVVDNGDDTATRDAVAQARTRDEFAVVYEREPQAGIPFARNTAIRAAVERDADALVFLDDDEWPAPGWLAALLATWTRTGADIVTGPAKAVLPVDAPRWACTSGVFDKDRHLPDGAPIRTAYSYNTLLSRRALETLGPTFDPAFRYIGSSDHDYFKRATQAGLRAVWSPHALVYEEVRAERLTLRWVLKRGYRTGVGARLSARRRLAGPRAVAKIALLVVANAGYAGLNVVGTWHRRLSWVEGLRRLGIAAGLALGNVAGYEEYRPDSADR